jgi:GT2 family glycosyltransferase
MDKLVYVTPTYKCFDLCRKSIEAVLKSTVLPNEIVVIDNSGTGAALPYLEDLPMTTVWPQPRNLGVAASWNMFMDCLEAYDYVIIANDDIEVDINAIDELYSAAATQDGYIFAGSNSSGNAFSFFLLKRAGYEAIGPFDETFYPAYFEDGDYARRVKLLGYPLVAVETARYKHTGSSTLKRYNQLESEMHHQSFRRNESYYLEKWGGHPGAERFEKEFNAL